MRLSVIVPVSPGSDTVERCRAAIEASLRAGDELIVVDAVTPASPARRRNDGARRASGEVLVFVDDDVVPHGDALARIRAALGEDPQLDGVFGCYDDSPEAPGHISRFRNLLHHHVHMQSGRQADTFWSGLGAIRRDTFLAAGGFDGERYPRAMIEDIELGARIGDLGGRLELRGEIQGTHLKRWTLSNMVYADLVNRGVPWVRLMLERRRAPATLNLAWRHRLSALTFLGIVAALLPGVKERGGDCEWPADSS